MVDKKEIEEVEKTKAERKQLEIDTILNAATRLDDESTVRYICETLELDYEEVQKRLEEQDYEEPEPPEVVIPDE